MFVARTAAQVNPPAASPPTSAGMLQVSAILAGPGFDAPSPGPIVPVYHADLAGPALPPGTPVVVAVSQGGHYYIAGAALAGSTYIGPSPAAVAAQSGFSSF